MIYDLFIIGGGAAGIFAANVAKKTYPFLKIAVVEKTAVLLAKVRISGGGRCNVTHNCFDPRSLSKGYPRGERELIGLFHRFQATDIIDWFESRGVRLKTEEDGRIFPTTDQSETIIKCLLQEAEKLGVEIITQKRIEAIYKKDHQFYLTCKDNKVFTTHNLLLATGSNKEGYEWAKQFGHSIQQPIPSLFTFNVPNSFLKECSGISLDSIKLHIKNTPYSFKGPLLITHFGFSGPAVIKLSAWAAKYLYEKRYCTELLINWLPELSIEKIYEKLSFAKQHTPQKTLICDSLFAFPRNFWKVFLEHSGEVFKRKLCDIPNKDLRLLSIKLNTDIHQIEGKTTNKEEFVTCGGITLSEVDFKTMQSKICPGLFFAGEILDIDGITGGFNFQNAWTTGFVAGSEIARSIKESKIK